MKQKSKPLGDIRQAQKFSTQAAAWQDLADKIDQMLDDWQAIPLVDLDISDKDINNLYSAKQAIETAADARRMDARNISRRFIRENKL